MADINNTTKPFVSICSYCENINDPRMAEFANGIDPKVKDEMKVVNEKVKENKDKFTFSHGTCQQHLVQNLQKISGMTKERIASMIEKSNQGNPIPCLLTNEPFRHAFMKGLFTPELIKQATQSTQQSNQKLTERFKKLAGIKD